MSKGCFSQFNGYEVKDAAARKDIADIKKNLQEGDGDPARGGTLCQLRKETGGATEYTVNYLYATKPDPSYEFMVGDKLISLDNYLYEVKEITSAALPNSMLHCELLNDLNGKTPEVGRENVTGIVDDYLKENYTMVNPIKRTSQMGQQIGVDENGKLWTITDTGRLFYSEAETGGANTIDASSKNVQEMPNGIVPGLGDKILTKDGYLYNVDSFSLGSGSGTSYTASLICAVGGGAYDCVIAVNSNRPPNAGENVTYSVVSGSLLAVWEKVNSGKKPNVLLQYMGETDGDVFNNFSEAVHVEHVGYPSAAGLYMDFIMGGELVQLSSDSNADITGNVITSSAITSLTGGGEEYDLTIDITVDWTDNTKVQENTTINFSDAEVEKVFEKLNNGEEPSIIFKGTMEIDSGGPIPVFIRPTIVRGMKKEHDGYDYYTLNLGFVVPTDYNCGAFQLQINKNTSNSTTFAKYLRYHSIY